MAVIAPIEIVSRKEYEHGLVVYTVKSQSREGKEYYVRILNGHANGCTCPTNAKYTCKHHRECQRNEQERTNDTMQHVRDSLHSCLGCGYLVKKPESYCYNCLA